MKRKLILLIFAGMAMLTFAQQTSQVSIHATVVDKDIPLEAAKNLVTKMQQLLTSCNFIDNGADRFVLTARVNITSKDVAPTTPARISEKMEITFLVGDIIDNKLYESFTMTSSGIGTTEAKALISAFQRINISNPEIKSMLERAQTKIINYYANHCDDILTKANTLSTLQKYDEAMFYLMSIPEVCSDCYKRCQSTAASIYDRKLTAEGELLLNKARNEWLLGQDNAAANRAADILVQINPQSSVYAEATKIALRSAIEQAYGTFVSANSTILNDDMVKDEIVTISNGNIKSYQEIASAILPNGRTTVTLNAVVSISKLTSYAKSKGVSTEFAGATFAMNVKMRELNKKNEMKALDNLMIQVENLIPKSFDRSLVIGEPELCTKNSLPKSFLEDNKQINPDNYYVLPLSIQYKTNENIKNLLKLIYSTLSAIEPTVEEYNYFKTNSSIKFDLANLFIDRSNSKYYFRTRLSRKQSNYYEAKMRDIFINYFTDFEIIDNTGAISSFNAKLWGYNNSSSYSYIKEEYFKEEYDRLEAMIKNEKKIPLGYYYGTGIFNPIVYQPSGQYSKFFGMFEYKVFGPYEYNISRFFTWDYFVLIPKADIAKYTQFTIQPKTK